MTGGVGKFGNCCATSELWYLISRYSLCDNTPNAVTVAATTGREALQPRTTSWSMATKTIFFELSSDTPHVVTATVAALGVSSHGLWRNILTRLESPHNPMIQSFYECVSTVKNLPMQFRLGGRASNGPSLFHNPFALVFQSSPVLGRARLEIRIRAIMSGSDTTQFMAEPSQIEHRFTPPPPLPALVG